jgi:nucleoside-diphosphate-sugar epimerase
MVGFGNNRKSIAYVENVAAFIEYCINFKAGLHIYNYIDKPDFTMNGLVSDVNRIIGRPERVPFTIPFIFGFFIGKVFDFVGFILNKRFTISSIRVKKFCANSVFNSSIDQTGFIPPVSIEEALAQTVRYEFLELNENEGVFYSE